MAELITTVPNYLPVDCFISEVYKKVGDFVNKDDLLVEFATPDFKEKYPLNAFHEGTLLYFAGIGACISKNKPVTIAIIGKPGEDIQSILNDKFTLFPTSYEYHFSRYRFDCDSFLKPKIYKIHKEDGDYVKKGDIILILGDADTNKYYDVTAEIDGYLDFDQDFNGNIYDVFLHCPDSIFLTDNKGKYIKDKNGELIPAPKREHKFAVEPYKLYINLLDRDIIYWNWVLFYIHENDQDRINRKFVNEFLITSDPFTNSKNIGYFCKSIYFRKSRRFIVSPSLNKKEFLQFSLNNIGGKDYIVFRINPLELVLSKDDSISFLFENEQVIEFKLSHVPYKVLDDDYYETNYYETKVTITDNELLAFQNINFKLWKIHLNKTNQSIVGGDLGFDNYFSKKNLIIVIKKYATEYRELVRKEVENYLPLYDHSIAIDGKTIIYEECYVYLMVDHTNNHHKIGISNSPDFREKTLQSEKPTIEMIAAKKFINRKIAASFEKALHNTYSKKRIRGEWFKLDAHEIHEIKSTLEN